MEWSDRELARLKPIWIKTFLRQHVIRCALLAFLYLMALTFLGASVERYWHWLQSVEAVAGEPIRTVDRWTAYCRVNPLTRSCRPAHRLEHKGEASVTASGVEVAAIVDGSQLINGRAKSY